MPTLIPDFQYRGLYNEYALLDFGPQYRPEDESGIVTLLPPKLLGKKLWVFYRWFSDSKRLLVLEVTKKHKDKSEYYGNIGILDVGTGKVTPLAAVAVNQEFYIDLSPDTVVIAGHGAGVQPNLVALPTVEHEAHCQRHRRIELVADRVHEISPFLEGNCPSSASSTSAIRINRPNWVFWSRASSA